MTTATKLSVKQYRARRQRIRDEYQTMRNRANAYRDQHLAQLFNESGWTQQEIADEEGRSQSWVDYRLRFGRFCGFLTTMVVKKLPVNLSERKFREYWATWGKNAQANTPSEQKAFQRIVESDDWETQMADRPRIDTAKLIAERCCDNRYRTKEEIAEAIEEPDDGANRVSNVISRIRSQNSAGLMVMDKTFAGNVLKHKFRVVNKEAAKIRAPVLISELSPIVEELDRALNQHLSQDAVKIAKGTMHRLHQLVKRYS